MEWPKFPPLTPIQKCLKWQYKVIGIPMFYGLILLKWFLINVFPILLVLIIGSQFKNQKNKGAECLQGVKEQGYVCENGKKYSASLYMMKSIREENEK